MTNKKLILLVGITISLCLQLILLGIMVRQEKKEFTPVSTQQALQTLNN